MMINAHNTIHPDRMAKMFNSNAAGCEFNVYTDIAFEEHLARIAKVIKERFDRNVPFQPGDITTWYGLPIFQSGFRYSKRARWTHTAK